MALNALTVQYTDFSIKSNYLARRPGRSSTTLQMSGALHFVRLPRYGELQIVKKVSPVYFSLHMSLYCARKYGAYALHCTIYRLHCYRM